MHCGPCIWSGLVRVFYFLGRPFWKLCKWRSAFKENAKAKHCQGKKRKRFSSFLQNLSGASSLCVRDEVFWTEDLIEKTTKRLHDSYTILTLIEHDMSARLNCSLPNLVPRVFVSYYTCWVSERRRREWECPLPWSSGRRTHRLLAPDRFCKKDEDLFCFFPWQCFTLAFSLKALLHLQSFQNDRPRK